MGRDAFADRETILDCLDAIEAAHDRLRDCSLDGFSSEELVAVLARRERVARRAPTVDHQILARLVADGNPGQLGAATLSTVLVERLAISRAEARRRLADAADLGPRTTLTGQPLEPVLPAVAAAQAAGRIGAEHIAIARKAHANIPATVNTENRARAEQDLALLATRFGPEAFQKLADHLIAVLDPDGDFTDRDRQARRRFQIGRQRCDGLSTLTAAITPELRAALEPLLAKLAAPGMCNPADEHPCVCGTPTEEQIRTDDRTPAQRHHDALLAICRIVLSCEDIGQLNGLPVTVIVTTTLAEIQAAAGCAETPAPEPEADTTTGRGTETEPTPPATQPVPTPHPIGHPATPSGKALTAGGTLLPMRDLLRMASHAIHYLAVFDGTGRALWLGRTKRIATADQRIILHARDRGCTRPGCTVTGYHTQAHHLEHDWAHGGHTNIDTLALACPADNRMATQHHWTTHLDQHGHVEWIPPPTLDRGQPRTNPYHFIEDLTDHQRQQPDAKPPDKPDGDQCSPDLAGWFDDDYSAAELDALADWLGTPDDWPDTAHLEAVTDREFAQLIARDPDRCPP